MFRIFFISLFMTTVALAQTATIKVVDQFSMPVAKALVLIGNEQGIPFDQNLLTADDAGEIVIPKAWINQENITVDAAGFIRQTLLNQSPETLVVRLNRSQLSPLIFVSGQITDLPVVNKDKLIDFSLVTTTFSQNDFVHLNQEQFISPFADALTILGKSAPVFSNVSLPEQKESYLLPLTVSKPTYTKFLSSTGDKKIIALSGLFPFKQVADDLKDGKSFFDIINYFEIFTLGNLNITLNKSMTNANFSGVSLHLDETLSIKAPTITAEEQVLVLPMNTVSNYYLPSGIKKLNSAQSAKFNVIDNAAVSVLAMVKKAPEFSLRNEQIRLSALFVKPQDPTATLYLPLMDDASVHSKYPVNVTTNVLVAPQGLYASGTMAVISDISDVVYNKEIFKISNPKWEVYSSQWEHSIQLPKWPLDVTAPKAVTKTFETTYFAQGQTPLNTDVKSMLDGATHLTKSSVNLQY